MYGESDRRICRSCYGGDNCTVNDNDIRDCSYGGNEGMKEMIEQYADVCIGVSTVIFTAVMLGYALGVYREILLEIIKACLG